MLFKGIDESETALWQKAVSKAHADVSMWREIVGVDTSRATDTGLFRVLEWGGMEVV